MALRRYIKTGILIILMTVVFAGTVTPEPVPDNIGLTQEEKEFIKGRKMRLGVDSARPPYEFIDETGVYSGISAGFIETCAKRLGIEIVLVPGLNVGAAMKKMKEGEIDLIPKISPDPERAKSILFTKPYSTFAAVIVTRKDVRRISGVDNLEGLKVAVLKGLIVETRIKRDYPNMPLISISDIKTALLDLSAGKIDVLIDNMAIVSYNIDRLGLNNLKIAGHTPYHYDMAFGIRKDWPLLASALDKTLSGMSKKEKTVINDRWLTVEYQQVINWRIVGPIAGALIVIIVFVVIWNRRLRAVVRQREEVQQELKQYAQELESRAAIKSHISQISSVLQKAVTLEELAVQLLSHLAPLVGAAYGVLYVFDKESNMLRSAGGYGCVVKEKTFAIGQGLVGQCAFEQAPIKITGQSGPSGSDIKINWGAGEALPKEIIVLPIIQNAVALGVIELAGMAVFSKDALLLLDELMPIIAMNIEILTRNLRTNELLEATRQLASKLNTQQRMLKETETWYHDIIESSPNGILVVNQTGEIILSNLMADRTFGYDSGELIGKCIDILVPKSIRAGHPAKRDSFFKQTEMHSGINVSEVTVTGVRKDGTEFPALLGLSPLREDVLRGRCVCASIKDISALRANADVG
ncbi:transporter substrate-binding domain-containing protein [Candidatus Magnetominusculus xianensis]|uniref:Signal transduction histidine kinase n=1 Tax=Candidatus Magnetominusculus xianensis TaxID=1748249 RepID=A0ABR5SJR0_9BACT|nr:transporter substrate-binding domain-containing protein [Candidatus Magnetominusculus xianensis]KWT95080.1 signal transduction histidine kinase [Candidatus Magnetominusculus xianensis]MBF0402729.1 transporter substrate-binding domain-containing protein [Nitrospirota bacterium]